MIEADDGLVACGGWSRRGKLYTGSGDAADDDRIIDPATEGARVRAMFTRPDRTRQGLGTRILEACEAAAKAEGFRFLILVATLAGVPLYEHYGFREVERRRGDDARRHDGRLRDDDQADRLTCSGDDAGPVVAGLDDRDPAGQAARGGLVAQGGLDRAPRPRPARRTRGPSTGAGQERAERARPRARASVRRGSSG